MTDNTCKNLYNLVISDYELNALEVIKEHLMQPDQSKLGLLACDVLDGIISGANKIPEGKISGHAGGKHVDLLEGAIQKMAEIFKLQTDYKEIRFYADRVVYVTYTIEEKTEMEITKYYDKVGLEYRFLPITQIPICESSTK